MKWIGTQTIYDHVRLNKGITLDGVSITTIQSSGESFVDNDTSLMTSAAILDKIQATGDITGVTAGTGLSGGGTSGTVTLNVDAAQTGITSVGTLGSLAVTGSSGLGGPSMTLTHQDTDQIALDINASNTTGKIIDINAQALTDGEAIYIDCNNLTGLGSALYIDVDESSTTGIQNTLSFIDYNRTGDLASVEVNYTTGLNISMNDLATGNHSLSTSKLIGLDINLDHANANALLTQQVGIDLTLTDADTGYVGTLPATAGIMSTVENGGFDIVMRSSADTGDHCTIATTTHGATTITTVDDNATAAHFEIAADGDIILDSAGQIKLEPATGNNILLDGTIQVDAGVVTGATSITSTAFVGDVSGSSGSCTGQAATVATIAGLAPNTATTQATQPNITTLAGVSAIGTAGTPITITSDTVTFQSANADDPIVTIKNTSDDTNEMASLKFVKDRGAAPDVGTNLAEIYFIGEDSGQNEQEYGRILSEIDVATHGQESGVLKFGVANHDGGNGYGLIMTGGSANDEVDVTLGLGAASVVTIPGDIDLAGDIDVDGTLEADAITLGGTALGSLYSPIAGSSSIVTTGTIGTGTWQGTPITKAYLNADQGNITTVGTIGSGTWQGTAVASAYLDADTAHYSAQRQLTHYMFRDNLNTTKHYVGLQEADSESETASNKNLAILAPVAGKLLKVYLRATTDLSGKEFTWTLETHNSSSATGGTPTVVGTVVGAGCTASSMTTYNFASPTSGDNVIDAGDTVQLAITSDASASTANYYITCLWEWDLS